MSPVVQERPRGGFNLDDYVTVAERIGLFYDKYPDGSLQAELVELASDHVVVRGLAYRTASDERPGIAHSALMIPGTTPYTRGSEIENAETSAIGRAIAMLGFGVKKSIATSDEIRTKEGAGERNGQETHSPDATADGGLIGIARVLPDKRSQDGQLRMTPTGHSLGFRLAPRTGTRGGMMVEAADALALALDAVRSDWVDQPVTAWGRLEPREFTPPGKPKVKYQALVLARLQTPTVTLPVAEEEIGALDADAEREIEALAF